MSSRWKTITCGLADNSRRLQVLDAGWPCKAAFGEALSRIARTPRADAPHRIVQLWRLSTRFPVVGVSPIPH